MPQIRPYVAQTNVQGGLSTAQMSPDAAQAQGRGLVQLGQAVSDVGQAIKNTEDLVQTTDAAAKMAELRVRQTNLIKEASMNGDVNPDKILEDYNNEVQNLMNQYSSGEARSYLSRANNELRTSIATNTFAAQAELTRVKVLDSKQKQMSSWSAVLATDPTQRESILKEYEEYNAKMPLSAQMKEKMRYEDMKNLDVAEFRGRISLLGGQGDLDKAVNSLNALKTSLEGGAFKDRAFDDETIRQLSREITGEISGREVEASRRQRLEEKAKQERFDANMNSAYVAWEQDKLSYDDVKKLDLPWDYKERLKNIMKADTRREQTVNSSYWTSKYFDDIRNNLITDGKPIEDAYVRGEITKQDMGFLTKQLDFFKRPEGAQFKDELSNLNKFARSKLVQDSMGMRDPDGEKQYAMFQQEMMREFQNKRAQGISAEELLDPTGKSANSLYNTVGRFQRSTQEKMDSMIKSMNPQQDVKFKSIDDYENSKGK